MGRVKNNSSRQIDKKVSKQVRIDAGMHKEVKIEASKLSMTIRDFVEAALGEVLSPLNK